MLLPQAPNHSPLWEKVHASTQEIIPRCEETLYGSLCLLRARERGLYGFYLSALAIFETKTGEKCFPHMHLANLFPHRLGIKSAGVCSLAVIAAAGSHLKASREHCSLMRQWKGKANPEMATLLLSWRSCPIPLAFKPRSLFKPNLYSEGEGGLQK